MATHICGAFIAVRVQAGQTFKEFHDTCIYLNDGVRPVRKLMSRHVFNNVRNTRRDAGIVCLLLSSTQAAQLLKECLSFDQYHPRILRFAS